MQPISPPTTRHQIHLGAKKKILGFALSLAAACLRLRNRLLGPPPNHKKAVLLEPFGLGDIISLQPLVRSLLDKGCEVVLCGKTPWKALFPPQPRFTWLNSELPWGTHDEKAKYRLSALTGPGFRHFLRRFRQEALGGVGFDTRGDIRSVITLYLAGCSRVITLSHYIGSDMAVPAVAGRLIPYDRDRRRWEMNLRFLSAMSPPLRPAPPRPPAFAHLGAPALATGKIIGIIPIAPWPGRLWAPEKWSELIEALRRQGFEPRAFCGPGQESLTREQAGEVEIVACPSIEAWARALLPCRMVVTLDTGPMHLADALGIPVVSLFGPGLLPLWAPSEPRSRIVAHQDFPGAVCHQVDANIPIGRKSMGKITVVETLAAIQDCLSS